MKRLVAISLLFPWCLYAQQRNKDIKTALLQNSNPTIQQQVFPFVQRTTSVNTCDTWSFQVSLQSSATEHPADIIQLPTASYIICGSNSIGSSINGRLIKLDPSGKVVLSKDLNLPGQHLELIRLHYLSTGQLYATGTSTDVATRATLPVLINIDTSTLTPLSVFKWQPSSGPFNWQGFDLSEGLDNTLYLLSNNDSLVNITKFVPGSLSVVWSKTYRPKNKPQMVGLGSESLYVYVAWNEQDSGYTKGAVMSLDHSTGKLLYETRVGGSAEGVNIQLQGMCVVNLRPRFTALQYNSSRADLIRINYDPDTIPTFREFFTIEGFTPLPGMTSRQNAWGESLALQQQPGSSQINIVQTFPDNYFDKPIRSWNLNFPQALDLKRHRIAFDGGNITLAEYSGGGILVSKSDSVVSACSSEQVVAASRVQYRIPHTRDTLLPLPYIFQLVPASLSETDFPLSQTVLCQTLSCPLVEEPDSCQRTFFKEYRNSTNCVTANELIKASDGNMLMTGWYRQFPYSGYDNLSFTKIDTLGRVKDARLIQGKELTVTKTISLRDGNFLAVGTIGRNYFGPHDLYLVKFDPQFSILWQHRLTSNPFYNGFADIIESSEGDLYAYLTENITARDETRTVVKLNASGLPVWMQQYSIGPTIFAGSNEHVAAIVELGDAIVLKYNDEDSDYSPYLMSIRKTDGAINWIRKYQMDRPFSGSNVFSLASLLSDGHNIYMLGRTQQQDLLLKIRSDGSVSLAKKVSAATIDCNRLSLQQNGRLLVSVTNYLGTTVNGVVEMDTSFRILRTQYMHKPKYGSVTNMIPFGDSVVYTAGSLWADNIYWASVYFQKYNFNSSFSSCQVTDQVLVLDSITQPVSTKTILLKSLQLPQVNSATASFVPVDISYSAYYCGNNPTCTDIRLQGTTTICDTSNVYSFRVQRNRGCNGFVLWNMDTLPSQINVVSLTDSVLTLKVRKSGIFTLRVKLFSTCGWLEDSLTVQATAAANKIDLGADTLLCPGNFLRLHAGPGFDSYLWQDGSTDSVFTASQPGLYYVQTTSCGNVFADTVFISEHPPIPFDLGPDRTKCNSDTLHLSAPSGFLNYSWSNNYNISSANSQKVIVNPLSDTAYYVKAEKTPGCFAYDTVRIHVNTSPAISLGADKSFCNGDMVVFDGGTGFNQYVWNTGSNAQQITVKTAGTFSVIGITGEGCKSYDTVRVSVFSNPVVSLDRTDYLCTGSSRILDAGSYSSYLWNDGSTSQKIIAKNIGIYAVEVRDALGCKGRDTTRITSILPLPSHFLPNDTLLCSYDKLKIAPNESFNSYQWSTGASASSLTISQPGTYWLQVKDGKGCVGRDSIVIDARDCMKGCYVPTAFSPNKDGKNDLFRPMLFGRVKKFQFIVYNRWGQVVFQTTESNRAWDGRVAGVEQDPNVFVWVCNYQFEGEEEKTERGSVMLVR